MSDTTTRAKDPTAAERARRYRARKRERVQNAMPAVRDVSTVTAVTPSRSEPVKLLPPLTGQRRWQFQIRALGSLVLAATAAAIAWYGLNINAWYGATLGKNAEASALLSGLSITADLLALIMPATAAVLWRDARYGLTVAAWSVWTITVAITLMSTIGFASVNIADTTLARAERGTPAIATARSALADAKAARDRECTRGVGPICRQREDAVIDRQRQMDTALRAVETAADPQADTAAMLLTWVTGGRVHISRDDTHMARVLGMTLLPQLSGLVLMLAFGVGFCRPELSR